MAPPPAPPLFGTGGLRVSAVAAPDPWLPGAGGRLFLFSARRPDEARLHRSSDPSSDPSIDASPASPASSCGGGAAANPFAPSAQPAGRWRKRQLPSEALEPASPTAISASFSGAPAAAPNACAPVRRAGADGSPSDPGGIDVLLSSTLPLLMNSRSLFSASVAAAGARCSGSPDAASATGAGMSLRDILGFSGAASHGAGDGRGGGQRAANSAGAASLLAPPAEALGAADFSSDMNPPDRPPAAPIARELADLARSGPRRRGQRASPRAPAPDRDQDRPRRTRLRRNARAQPSPTGRRASSDAELPESRDAWFRSDRRRSKRSRGGDGRHAAPELQLSTDEMGALRRRRHRHRAYRRRCCRGGCVTARRDRSNSLESAINALLDQVIWWEPDLPPPGRPCSKCGCPKAPPAAPSPPPGDAVSWAGARAPGKKKNAAPFRSCGTDLRAALRSSLEPLLAALTAAALSHT